MKKTMSLLLVLLLCLGLMSGCGSDAAPAPGEAPTDSSAATDIASSDTAGNPSDSEASVYPLCTDGSITLSIMLPLTQYAPGSMSNYLDGTNLVWPEVLKRTGVNLDMTCVANASYQEQANLTIVSQILPDIMQVMNYAGGMDQAYDDGLFVELNDYQQYFPNYMKYVNMSDANQKAAYSEGGHMMGLSQVAEKTKPATLGMYVRQDWLDTLNLEIPTKISEWHDMLLAFKNNITGGGAPMDWSSDGFLISNFMCGNYGICGGLGGYWVVRDNRVIYSPADEGFRSYLEELHSWYNEGLINQDFMSNELGAQFSGNMDLISSNTVGALQLTISMGGAFFRNIGMLPEDGYYTMAPFPLNEDGSLAKVQPIGKYAATVGNGGWMISAESQQIEHALQFLDYFYSDEGLILTNYGIEGETFEYDENGKPMQNEFMTANPTYSQLQAQELYLIHNYFILSVDREFANIDEEGMKCWDYMNTPGEYNMPALSFTADETSENASIASDLETFISEMTIKWIIGSEELTDSSWNAYLQKLSSMNYETLVSNYQAAYDRWLAK